MKIFCIREKLSFIMFYVTNMCLHINHLILAENKNFICILFKDDTKDGEKKLFTTKNFIFFANLPYYTAAASQSVEKMILGYFYIYILSQICQYRQVTTIMMNHAFTLFHYADPYYLFKTSSSSSHSNCVQTHTQENKCNNRRRRHPVCQCSV